MKLAVSQRPTRKRAQVQQLLNQDTATHGLLQKQAPAATSRQFWLVELWQESRGIFKELIKHVLFFLLLLGSLIGFHELLAKSGLPASQKELLDKVHFYASIITLLIFSGSFVIKVILFEVKGTRG